MAFSYILILMICLIDDSKKHICSRFSSVIGLYIDYIRKCCSFCPNGVSLFGLPFVMENGFQPKLRIHLLKMIHNSYA
jgi:hypothetical protein